MAKVMMRFAMVSVLQKVLPWEEASSVLPLKNVMRREWEPNMVGAEVCPEAIDAESRGGEQWTVRVLRNCAYVCVSPEGVRERTPCDVK